MVGDPDFFRDEEETKTAFNSSLDIIQRISRYEYSLGSCLLFDDLRQAFKFLRLIYSEIDFKLKTEDIEEIDTYVQNLLTNMEQSLGTYINDGKVFLRNAKGKEEFRESLFELKRVLNSLKYKVGLGMTDLSDPRYALING